MPIIIKVKEKSKIKINDGIEKMEIEQNKPMMGLYIPKMIWKDMYDFSPDSILLVLASRHYDGNEYIRDYDEYIKLMREEQFFANGAVELIRFFVVEKTISLLPFGVFVLL